MIFFRIITFSSNAKKITFIFVTKFSFVSKVIQKKLEKVQSKNSLPREQDLYRLLNHFWPVLWVRNLRNSCRNAQLIFCYLLQKFVWLEFRVKAWFIEKLFFHLKRQFQNIVCRLTNVLSFYPPKSCFRILMRFLESLFCRYFTFSCNDLRL